MDLHFLLPGIYKLFSISYTAFTFQLYILPGDIALYSQVGIKMNLPRTVR